jgi:ubiquinone/menaquinone biosynthesis C-methylase UbiE
MTLQNYIILNRKKEFLFLYCILVISDGSNLIVDKGSKNDMNHGERFINSIFPELYNLARNDTSLSTGYFDRLVTAQQFSVMFDAINTFAASGVKVLDWGCGLGHISYCLDELGYSTSSYSIQDRPKLIDFMTGKQGKKNDFKKGDERDPIGLPYLDETFECVLSCGVLEHVREGGGNELSSLGEIKRVLKKEGTFICAHFPNKYGLTYLLSKLLASKGERESTYTIGYHKYTYTKTHVLKLCEQSGLELLYHRRYNFLPRNIFLKFGNSIGNNQAVSLCVNMMDSIMESLFPFFCTSHVFVAKKK